MQEYVLYIVFIFIPIGLIMTWLLHKDGYETRDIIIVNAVSFLMIVFFPISMSRLGTVTSVIVYIMALVVMAAFIMHPWIIKAVQLRQPLGANAGNAGEATGNNNESMSSLNRQNIELTNKIQPSEDKEDGFDLDEKISSVNIELNQLIDANEQPEYDNQSFSEENIEPEKPNTDEAAAVSEELISEVRDIKIESEMKDDSIQVMNGELAAENIEQVKEIESSETNEDSADEKPGNQLELCDMEEESVDNGSSEDKSGVVLSDFGPSIETWINPVESDEVLNVVGLGFDYKLQGHILNAAEAFTKAYKLAQGEGMRCLLGLERVYIYKEIGAYSKAKELLNELVGFTQVEPAIMREINKQIVYIEVLIRELSRLRMGNMPASSVPRLVRLKVAEEIELLESGRE